MTAVLAAPSRPHKNPVFVGWLGGYGLSLVGDQVYGIAFAFAAAQLGNPALTALVAAASSIPRAVLLLFGGALGDRVGLRKLMLTADVLRVLVMAVAALAGLGGTPLWLLLAASLVFGVVDAAYLPAVTALPAQILPADQLPAATAARGLVIRLALLGGAPLGGLLVTFGGFTLACAVNAVSFAVSVVILAKIKPQFEVVPAAKPRQHLLADVRAGIGYVAKHPTLRTLFLVLTALEFAVTGPVNIGIPLLSVEHHWGAAGPGWALGGLGAGAVVGSLLVIVAKRWRRPVLAGFAFVASEAVGVILLGVAPSIVVAAVGAAMVGFAGGITSALLGGMIQSLIDPEFRARVGSIFVLQGVGLTPVALTGFGLLASLVGTAAACVGCGLLLAVVVAVSLTTKAARTTPA